MKIKLFLIIIIVLSLTILSYGCSKIKSEDVGQVKDKLFGITNCLYDCSYWEANSYNEKTNTLFCDRRGEVLRDAGWNDTEVSEYVETCKSKYIPFDYKECVKECEFNG